MISEQSLPATSQTRPQLASQIPAQTHEEARALAQAEFACLLPVVEALQGDDWQQPTYCTLWSVRELVAHLAGGAATFSSFGEFLRHYLTNPHAKEWKKPEDACNYLQVKERAARPAAEVVREFRELAPKEIRARYRLPWIVRLLLLPSSPPITVGYLTDTVLTRDWWAHRLDLCHATGQEMQLTPEHDGRLTALVVRDMAKKVRKGLGQRTIDLQLAGTAGGTYRFGKGHSPNATITMDAIDFHLLASGRITADDARVRALLHGDAGAAQWLLDHCEVLY